MKNKIGLSAELTPSFFYGIGLYSYAVIWPIVPIMLLKIIYGVWLGKFYR